MTKTQFDRFFTRLNTFYLIFILAFLYRLPHITRFINDDDSLWKYRGYVFGDAMTHFDFARTAVTYHPGVPLMWSQMFAIKTYGVLDDIFFKGSLVGKEEFFYNHLIQNIFLLVITSCLISSLYLLLKRIVSEKFAILITLIFLLEPFFVSLGRSIHNDLLVSVLMYLTFLTFFILISTYNGGRLFKRRFSYLVGLFFALALLTKSASLFLVPMLISTLLLFIISDRKISIRYIKVLGISILLMAIFFVVIWPAMWVSPLNTLWLYFYKGIFDTAIEDGHLHTWFGKDTMDPGVWFYPIVIVARYSPELFITSILGIFVFLVKEFKSLIRLKSLSKTNKFLLLNLIYFAGYFVMIAITAKKLDRYSLPLIFPLAIFAAYAVYQVYYRIKSYKKTIMYVLLIFLVLRIATLVYIHPNYLVYYSPLVGGFEKGRMLIEPKWVIGFDQVSDYLNYQNSISRERINVVSPDAHLLSYMADFRTIYPENTEARRGEYFVVPSWKKSTSEMMKSKFKLSDDQIVKEIRIAGVLYYYIYKK